MNVLVTAGPTREYIDPVRFITNASSGRMGYAVARAACHAGHEVTLLAGPTGLDDLPGVAIERFTTVSDLQRLLNKHFPQADVLVMAAAVGDFAVEHRRQSKIPRSAGAISLRLVATPDLLAGLAGRKQASQTVIAFAVETGTTEQIEAKVRDEMARKAADVCVVNRPVAMGAEHSDATILSRDDVLLPWARRSKFDLAEHIVGLFGDPS